MVGGGGVLDCSLPDGRNRVYVSGLLGFFMPFLPVVAFLRLTFNNPLLCLTVSATLREKPIPTHPKHPLALYFTSIGGKGFIAPESPNPDQRIQKEESQLLDGLEEVNLLEGLLAGMVNSIVIP